MRRATQLHEALARVPRVHLGDLPTPLQELPRFSEALGGPRILIKRDDLTGLAFGGNKVRKLEYSMHGLPERGVEVVVSGAAMQSNFCRQATAAAARLGMGAHLCLMVESTPTFQGNLLLDALLGADIEIVRDGGWTGLHERIHRKAEALTASGRRAEALTGFEPVGAVGYVRALIELEEQCTAQGVRPDHLYLSSATGTQAGLEVAIRARGLDWRVVGVSAIERVLDSVAPTERLAEVAAWVAARLGLDVEVTPDSLTNEVGYVGPGYGKVSPEGLEAIRLLAGTEGILLDPVYTGKAMAGLIDHIRNGRVAPGETVVFLHTGGTPALFAYADELVDPEGEGLGR